MQISNVHRRLLAGRSRHPAPRHGQEEGGGDGRAARALHQRRARAQGLPQKKVEKIFDLMEQFAGYGFNKSHSARLRLSGLCDGVSEGALSGRFHGRAADVGNRQHRQGGEVHQRMPRHGHHACCRPTSMRATGISRPTDAGDPLRPGRGQERRAKRRSRRSAWRAQELGSFRSIYQFCENVDLGAINRRMIESLIKAGAMDSLEGIALAVVRRRRWRHRVRPARLARSPERPGRPVRRRLRGRRASGEAAAQRARLAAAKTSSPSKRKCSASTSPAIRSITIATR